MRALAGGPDEGASQLRAGIGQALVEEMHYDTNGELLTGTLKRIREKNAPA